MNVDDEPRRVADEEEEDNHEEDDGLLSLVGLALRRRKGLDSAAAVDARLLQLLRRSVDKLAATLDHPVDPVVQEAQADEWNNSLEWNRIVEFVMIVGFE